MRTIDICDGRIWLTQMPFNDVPRIKQLANARWHKEERAWSVPATPAVALQLSQEFRGCEFSFDHTWELLEQQASALIEAQDFKTCDPAWLPETGYRTLPSWLHQRRAFAFARHKEAAMLAMDMGTGKSRVAVDLALDWRCRAVLISCPANVMQVWRREFAIHTGDEYDVVLLNRDHRVSRRLLTAQMQLSVNGAKGRRTAIVINHEALWREPFGAWVKSADHPFDMFIFDESHRGKQHNGQLGKYIADLWRFVPNRLALTGTPFPHDQLDIFAQFRMLDPGVYGMSRTRFKERYAVMGGWESRQVVGVQNVEDLQRGFQLLAYQVFADDVLDLPEAIETFRTFKLTPEARKIYDQLEKEFYAEIDVGSVIARNALVKLLRLQQLTSGYCKVDPETGEAFEAFTGDEKINLLQDLLENELPRPVVVFCRFREDLRRIRELTGRLKLRYGEVSGAASDLNDDATLPDWIDVLGVQEQAGGLGIDLTRSHVAVFYSVSYKLDDYQQCMHRLRRPGQTKNVLYVHLVAENSIDEEIYEALTSRQELIDLLQNRQAA